MQIGTGEEEKEEYFTNENNPVKIKYAKDKIFKYIMGSKIN